MIRNKKCATFTRALHARVAMALVGMSLFVSFLLLNAVGEFVAASTLVRDAANCALQ